MNLKMSDIIKQQDSRRIFIDTLCELAEKDDKIVLIICDTGFNYIEKFQEKFPKQFFNFGVTEQSSVLICAAMALDGWKPYFYSMVNFVLFRPCEMVRNGIVKHNANVKLIGVKGSEKYKFLGFSHNLSHEKEDTNICENIGLKHYIPQNQEEVSGVILESYQENVPTYIRI